MRTKLTITFVLAIISAASLGIQSANGFDINTGAHITVSNKQFVVKPSPLIGPSHYELQGTVTNALYITVSEI
jgi:hypothetical protein